MYLSQINNNYIKNKVGVFIVYNWNKSSLYKIVKGFIYCIIKIIILKNTITNKKN